MSMIPRLGVSLGRCLFPFVVCYCFSGLTPSCILGVVFQLHILLNRELYIFVHAFIVYILEEGQPMGDVLLLYNAIKTEKTQKFDILSKTMKICRQWKK